MFRTSNECSRTDNAMPIRLTVFDVAGTTILDDDAVIDAIETTLGAGGVHAERHAIKALMGVPKPLAIRELLSADPTVPNREIDQRTDEMHAAFVGRLLDRYRSDPMIRAVPDTVRVFRKLRHAGIRVALDTGFSRDVLNVLLDRLGWGLDIVGVTVASDEVEKGRPHPHMIHRAMQLTGIDDPGVVAKVGDTPADIEQGRAARCGLVVGVTYGTHTRDELARFDVPLIDRLVDLLPLVGVA
jgi:phosphonatase-like hydrolase